ncbi:MAG: MarC family protein [Candidatus Puniceispirillales bacterium WSBS_2018_MAG_OTU23]
MIEPFIGTFLLAMVVIDPLSIAPIFLALVANYSKPEINRIIYMAIFTSIFILATFYMFGSIFLAKIGVDVSSFRIIGGILLVYVAIEMMFNKRTERKIDTADKAARTEELDSLAIFPLAIPLIAGPAAMTLAIVTSGNNDFGNIQHLLGFLPIFTVILLAGVSMKMASMAKFILTPVVTLVIQRVFGLILGALAAQFIIDGLKEAFI